MANKNGSFRTTGSNKLSWFNNVAKSLGYTSTELITSMTPASSEFISENASYVKDLVNDVKAMRTQGSKFSKMMFGNSAHMGLAKDALKNAMSDIKSGKIYNKDRQDSMYDDEFNMEDFGMEDFSEDVSTESSTPKSAISINKPTDSIPGTQLIANAINQQTGSAGKNAEAVVNTMTSTASSQIVVNRRIGSALTQGLRSINSNLSLLVDFNNTSMSKYVGASLKYYQDSLDVMNRTFEEMKSTASPQQTQTTSMDDNNPFLINGGLSIQGYIKNIKKNLQEQMDSNPFLQTFSSMFKDTDTLKYLAASPLSFISTKIMTTLIPTFLQKSMQNLDKSFSTFFPALLTKMTGMAESSSNPLLQLIGNVFGVNTKVKTTVDLSKYNRGKVPFDGETKAAITEVIPGYLRKILAAISGQEEIGFDYNSRKFRDVKSMKKDFERNRDIQARMPFMDSIDMINERMSAFQFDTQKQQNEFSEGINKFFNNLGTTGFVNPRSKKDKFGIESNRLSEVYDFGDSEQNRLFQQLLLSLPKNQLMKMMGSDVIASRNAVRDYMTNSEQNPLLNNANIMFNGLNNDEHLDKEGKRKKGFGLFNPVDKFDNDSLSYLRDIKSILLKGIRVFPSGGFGSMGRKNKSDVLSDYDIQLSSMEAHQKQLQKDNEHTQRQKEGSSDLTPDQIAKLNSRGINYISNVSLMDMNNEDIQSKISTRQSYLASREKANQKPGFTQWIGKFFKGDNQDKYNLLREKFNALISKPAQLLQSVFDKIDNTMYGIVFGRPEKNGETSFMDKTMAVMREKFDKLGDFIKNKVFAPIKEAFVGENGIITKFQNSDFNQNVKKKFKSGVNTLFGRMGSDGKRFDGLFSDVKNQLMDTWDGFRYYFNGKAYKNRAGVSFKGNEEGSVFGEVKRIFGNFKSATSKYLFGDKDSKFAENQKGVLTNAVTGIKQGFLNFRDALFGPSGIKTNASQSFKDIMASIKQKAPKSLAWGTIGAGAGLATFLSGGGGLLGSLLLPGGPIGGAIVGSTLGFLSQSDKFKNWLLGEKDANNQRIGGIISKSTQQFLTKNRIAIMGGAAIGALKPILGFGLLPSFFLPGGPIAGAILGMGSAMLVRSEGFQRMMFGEKDDDGKRHGGFLGNLFGKIKLKTGQGNMKNLLGNMGAGALGGAGIAAVIGKMGFLGAMLTPAGPIGGAVLGAAAGIALSSDRWKKALFGEWDDKTGLRKGGMIGKFANWFNVEVQGPLANQLRRINVNFQEWFTKKIANPFVDAISPMKKAFSDMVSTMQDWFKKGWDSFKTQLGTIFETHVGKPFGQFMQENVMKPLRGFMMKIVMGVGKVFAPIIEAPVKMLSAFSQGLRSKQERRGVDTMREDGWNDMTDHKGRKARGERLGFRATRDAEGNVVGKGIGGRIKDMYFSREARDNARYGENGASYAREEDARISARNAQQDAKFASMRQNIDESDKRLSVRRKVGLKYDYDNFTPEGINISRVYNIAKSGSAYKHFMQNPNEAKNFKQTVEDRIGFSMGELLQAKEGKLVDAGNLSRGQRKILSKALKSGLTGNDLRKKMGISIPTEESAPVSATKPEVGTDKGVIKQVADVIKEASPKAVLENTIAPMVKSATETLGKIANGMGSFINKTLKPNKDKVDNRTQVMTNKSTLSIPRARINRTKRNPNLKLATGSDDADAGAHIDYDTYSSRNSVGSSKKESGGLLTRIARDVRSIAGDVHGQLDGVGSNVFKLRKIIQKQAGLDDKDLTGSSNRDRIGIWGKIRRAMMHPLEGVINGIKDGVGFVTSKIAAFGHGVAKVTKSIVMVPINIVKGVARGIKNATVLVGKAIAATGKELIKLPGKLIGLVGDALGVLGSAVKALGPAVASVAKGIGNFIGSTVTGIGSAVKGLGKSIGYVASSIGKGIKNIVTNIGSVAGSLIKNIGSVASTALKVTTSTIGSILKSGGKLITGAIKGVTDLTLKTASAIGGMVKTVGKTILDVVSAPFKFISAGIGKLFGGSVAKEVVVKGGYLDTVKEVIVVNKVINNNGGGNGGGGGGLHAPSSTGTAGAKATQAANSVARGTKRILGAIFGKGKSSELPSLDKTQPSNTKAFVGRRNAAYETEQKSIAADAKANSLFRTGSVNHLTNIDNNTKRLADGFDDIFGRKRGLITTGLMLFISWIKRWLSNLHLRLPNFLRGLKTSGALCCGGSGGGGNGSNAKNVENISKTISKSNSESKSGEGSEGQFKRLVHSGSAKKKIPGGYSSGSWQWKWFNKYNKRNVNNPEDEVTRRRKEKEKKLREAEEKKRLKRGAEVVVPDEKTGKVYRFPVEVPDSTTEKKTLKPAAKENILKRVMNKIKSRKAKKIVVKQGKKGLQMAAGGEDISSMDIGSAESYTSSTTRTGGGSGSGGGGKGPRGPKLKSGKKGARVVSMKSLKNRQSPRAKLKSLRSAKSVPGSAAKVFSTGKLKRMRVGGKFGKLASGAANLLGNVGGLFKGKRGKTIAKEGAAASKVAGSIGKTTAKASRWGRVGKGLKTGLKVGGKFAAKGGMGLLKAGGKTLARLGTGLLSGGMSTAGWAALDAANGAYNADRILHKDSKDITAGDRAAAGTAAAVTGFVPIVDMADDMMGGHLKTGLATTFVGGNKILGAAKNQAGRFGRWAGGGIQKGVLNPTGQFFGNIAGGIGNGFKGMGRGVSRAMPGVLNAGKNFLQYGTPLGWAYTAGKAFAGTKTGKALGRLGVSAGKNIAYNAGRFARWSGLNRAANATKDALGTAWNATKSGVGTAVRATGGALGTAWNATKSGLGTAARATGNAAKRAWNGQVDEVKREWKGIKRVGSNIGNGIKSGANWMGKQAGRFDNWTSNGIDYLSKNGGSLINKGFSGIGNAAKRAWNGQINEVKSEWGNIKKTGSSIGNGIKSGASWVGNTTKSVGKGIGNGLASIGKFEQDAWKGVTKSVSGAVKSIGKGTSKAWKGISTGVGKGWTSVKTHVSSAAKTIGTSAKKGWSTISKGAGKAWTGAKKHVTSAAKTIGNAAKKGWTNISKGASKGWTSVKSHVGSATKSIASKTKSVWNAAGKLASSGWNKVKSGVGSVTKDIASKTKSTWNAASKLASAGWDKVKSGISSAAKAIATGAKEKWDSAKSAVTKTFSNIGSVIGKAASGIKSALTSAMSAAGSAVKGALSGIGNMAKSAFKAMTGKGPGVGGPGKIESALELAAENGKGFGMGNGKNQTLNGMTYYSQNDPRWANTPLIQGNGKGLSFAQAGCGPTTAAMVISSVTGKNVNPVQSLKDAQKGGFVSPTQGTNADFFKSEGQKYGVDIVQSSTKPSDITSQLKAGNPVILRGDSGSAYTKGGHFIVATGLTKDGKIKVNDPMSKSRSTKTYKPDKLMKNTTSAYVAERKKIDPTKLSSPNKFGNGPGLPVFGAGSLFSGYTVTSGYGYRNDPGGSGKEFHRGIDIAKKDGSPIKSFTNGTVIFAQFGQTGSGYGGYGNCVAIRDEKGYVNVYGHMKNITVHKGDKIKVGTTIGHQGATGRAFGSHLHYEVRKNGFGTDVDPSKYLSSYKANKDFKASKTVSSATADTSSSDSSTSAITSTLAPAIDELPSFASTPVDTLVDNMSEMFLVGTANLVTGKNNDYKQNLDSTIDATMSGSTSTTGAASSEPVAGLKGNGKATKASLNANLVTGPSKYTAAQLNKWINSRAAKGSTMYNQGAAFLKASKESGLSPIYLIAHAGLETGWGKSSLSRGGNFFGIGAFDSNPDNGFNYGDGIVGGANWIANHYAKKGLNTLAKMKAGGYATDPQWANKIAATMKASGLASGKGRGLGIGGPASYATRTEFGKGATDSSALRLLSVFGAGTTDNTKTATPDTKVLAVSEPRTPETLNTGMTDSYTAQKQQSPQSAGVDSATVERVITILQTIADNTKGTTDGIITLQDAVKKSSTTQTTDTTKSSSSDSKPYNANPMLGAVNNSNSGQPNLGDQSDYQVAKAIAGGRK